MSHYKMKIDWTPMWCQDTTADNQNTVEDYKNVYEYHIYRNTGSGNVYVEKFTDKSSLLDVKKIFLNDPVTVVIWADGSKEVVKCAEEDSYDPEVGVALCFMKKIFGSRHQFQKKIRECTPDDDSK